MKKLWGNKKGVSEVIGSVILVAIVLAMAGVVYLWLRTYVPKSEPECTDAVSIRVVEHALSSSSNGLYDLELNITNNGRFSVDGFYIKSGVKDKNPSRDLSKFLVETDYVTRDVGYSYVHFFKQVGSEIKDQNAFSPGETESIYFKNIDVGGSNLQLVEIIPSRYQKDENEKEVKATCGESKFTYTIA